MMAAVTLALLATVGCATRVACLCTGDGSLKAARVVSRPWTEGGFTSDALEGCRDVCLSR